jgi:hypothetical protein
LQEASSKYITYLSDDDLFLPHHLSSVLPALSGGVHFLHTLPVHVLPVQDDVVPDGAMVIPELGGCWVRLLFDTIDCAPSVEKLEAGRNFISLSGVAHSLERYRELPYGWRTTPEGTYTDLFMWQQFLASPGLRMKAVYEPTYVHLAKILRTEWSTETRVAELAHWSELVATADVAGVFSRAALELSQRVIQDRIMQIRTLHGRNDKLKQAVKDGDARAASLTENVAALSSRTKSLTENVAHLSNQLTSLQSSLEAVNALANEDKLAAAHETILHLKDNIARKEALLAKTLETLRAVQQSRVWRTANRLRENPVFSRVRRTIANYRSR